MLCYNIKSKLKEIKMHTFIDLFAGIGGFRVALEKKGLKCVFSSDIDKYARQAYIKNFKEVPKGDIKQVNEKDIPAHDILCGGFPCQSFSVSGLQKGFSDDRGQLFYDIIRIAKYHQPSLLLLENVKNILKVDNGKVIKTIVNELEKINYKVTYNLLNASEYGIPQSRERVYFVCIRKDKNLKYKVPQRTFSEIYLKDILEDNVDDNFYLNRNDIVIRKVNLNRKSLRPIRIGHIGKGSQKEAIYSINGQSPTMLASGGAGRGGAELCLMNYKVNQGNRIHSINGQAVTLTSVGGGLARTTGIYLVNKKVRRLSITECKRIMTFPDSHIVSLGTQGFKQVGNAVMPKMIELIYDSII